MMEGTRGANAVEFVGAWNAREAHEEGYAAAGFGGLGASGAQYRRSVGLHGEAFQDARVGGGGHDEARQALALCDVCGSPICGSVGFWRARK